MLKNIIYELLSLYRSIEFKIYKKIIIPLCVSKVEKKFLGYNVASISETAKILKDSNKSLGRFGDGEVSWLLNRQPRINDFESKSKKLSKKLINVLESNDDEFMVGLPDSMHGLNSFTSGTQAFWRKFFLQDRKVLQYLDKKKKYYNTGVSRPYIDYNYRSIADEAFNLLKQVWVHKKILIIEGNMSRLGINDDLFNDVKDIKRIECPSTNAFESYDKILEKSSNFLSKNKDYLVLISLGPTATILAYDLFKLGYRAIDVGHIDLEYEWYKMGAKERFNLPDKYVNELPGGHSINVERNLKYESEIVDTVKENSD